MKSDYDIEKEDEIRAKLNKFLRYQNKYPSQVVPKISELSTKVGDVCQKMYEETREGNVIVTEFNDILIIMKEMK